MKTTPKNEEKAAEKPSPTPAASKTEAEKDRELLASFTSELERGLERPHQLVLEQPLLAQAGLDDDDGPVLLRPPDRGQLGVAAPHLEIEARERVAEVGVRVADRPVLLPAVGLEPEAHAELELLRTFNCGIGMIAIVKPDALDAVADVFKASGETVAVLGEVIHATGDHRVVYSGHLDLVR